MINATRFALEVPQELFGDDFVETKLELRHACGLTQLRLKMNKMLVLLRGVIILPASVLKGLTHSIRCTSHVSSAASGAFVSNIPCISTAGNLSLCLKLSKAPGVDNIPYEALCVDLLWWRHAILQFLDLCRSLCCIPSVRKQGIVVPLPKATASAHRDGYRPITLTCCLAKILERLILNRIKPDVDPMFDESQAGFRFGFDVQVYGLLETLHIRRNATTFCAFLDIRKAFDVAWKDGALLRLHRAGVQDGLWHFLSDDLISDRTASARIQSTMSDDWDVEHGIGQGAVLSGFLL